MLKKCWDHFEETILVYSYLLVVPLLFVQVVSRYVFNHSLCLLYTSPSPRDA